MGSLFIEVGQCGCQIGAKLNPLLSNSYYCTRNRPPYRLHTIMIDTEPKVLKSYQQKPPKWLDLDNMKYFQHGRGNFLVQFYFRYQQLIQYQGNNWSYGYLHEIPQRKVNTNIMSDYKQFSHTGENKLLEVYVEENRRVAEFVVDRVRRELETVDCALAINVISSLGGGTGSGLGTRTIEMLADEFNISILSHVILPNMSGQTPLQIYNCLLSLSIIQQHSSAIFPIQNQKHLSYYNSTNQNTYFNTNSLEQINQQIAQNIKKLVKINDIPGYDRFYSMIASQHVLSNEMKYLSVMGAGVGAKVDPWGQCMQELLQKIRVYNIDLSPNQNMGRRECLLSGEVIAINKQPLQYEKKYKKKLQSALNPHETNLEFTQLFANATQQSSLLNEDLGMRKQAVSKDVHELLVVMNHSNISRYLRYLCEQGRLKYQNKAYLWHYEYVDIEDSLQRVQSTLDQYNMFTHQQI